MTFTSPLDMIELLEPHLRATVGHQQIIAGVVIVAVLLGVCSFTDLFRGRRIPNVISVSMIVAGMAAAPMLHVNPAVAYINALALGTLLFVAAIATGGIGVGDIKLYTALTLLLGPAGWLLYFVSLAIGILYGVPLAAAQQSGRIGKFGTPMAPAIALAFPVSLALLGVSVPHAAALAVIELVICVGILVYTRRNPPLHKRTLFYDELPASAPQR